MKLKNKLIFTCILALVVCVLLVPCAFAEEAEAAEGSEEFEVLSSEFVVDEVTETVAEPVEEPVIETEELKEELPPVEEAAEAAEPESDEKSEERIEKSEERVEQEEPKVHADFTAADGSVHSLELGSSVNLGEFLTALGYEGEVSSFASSNSDALDVNEEGQLVFKSAFADETITVIVDGQEVVIPVHDPTLVGTEDEIRQAFSTGGEIQMTADITITRTLTVAEDKTITLDLNGHVLKRTDNDNDDGNAIDVLGGYLTLKDSNPSAEHTGEFASLPAGGVITGGKKYGGVWVNGVFSMESGTICGNTSNSGGGVYNIGTFNMTGGAISDNSALYGGGGVTNYGAFTMTGGIITENSSMYANGVYDEGTMTVGGTAKIIDNNVDNLYLVTGKTVSVSTEVVPNGMLIGVTLASGTGDVTWTNAADYSACFESDNADYTVGNGANNVVQLQVKAISVDAPTAVSGLVYTSAEQVGVVENTGYTVENGKATNAGYYEATAKLAEGYIWSDGTTADKTINWSIARAPLIITAEAKDKYYDGTTEAEVIVTVSGVIGDDDVDVVVISAKFSSPDVGNDKDVKVEYDYPGSDWDNYYFPDVPVGTLKASILANPQPQPVDPGKKDKSIVDVSDPSATPYLSINGSVAEIVVKDKDGNLIAPSKVIINKPEELLAQGAKTAEIRMTDSLKLVLDIESAVSGRKNCKITIENKDNVVIVECDGISIFTADIEDIIDTVKLLVYDGETLKAYDAQGNLIREIEV